MIKKWFVKFLMLISRIETNYMYRSDKLDWDTYINRISYPQTWWMDKYIPFRLAKRWIVYKEKYYRNPLKRLIELTCGLITGHEVSITEFGYGGGEFVDRHCRWCDTLIQEPISESEWAKKGELSSLIVDMRIENQIVFDED